MSKEVPPPPIVGSRVPSAYGGAQASELKSVGAILKPKVAKGKLGKASHQTGKDNTTMPAGNEGEPRVSRERVGHVQADCCMQQKDDGPRKCMAGRAADQAARTSPSHGDTGASGSLKTKVTSTQTPSYQRRFDDGEVMLMFTLCETPSGSSRHAP